MEAGSVTLASGRWNKYSRVNRAHRATHATGVSTPWISSINNTEILMLLFRIHNRDRYSTSEVGGAERLSVKFRPQKSGTVPPEGCSCQCQPTVEELGGPPGSALHPVTARPELVDSSTRRNGELRAALVRMRFIRSAKLPPLLTRGAGLEFEGHARAAHRQWKRRRE